MTEEPGFEVVDKRRVNADSDPRPSDESPDETTSAPEAEADPTASDPSAGESDAKAEPGGMPPISARDLLVIYVNQLQELAWSRMGLTPNPVSGTIDRDLADARLAIDCTADMIGRLDPLLDASTRRDMQTLLANLRMNFVQQSQKG